MLTTLQDPNVGDGILLKLTIDLTDKRTTLVLKQWSGLNDGHYSIVTLNFEGVTLQNFDSFYTFNILFGIEYSQTLKDFAEYEPEYLQVHGKYIGQDDLDKILADQSLSYYRLIPSS